jgi:hypothetical protein
MAVSPKVEPFGGHWIFYRQGAATTVIPRTSQPTWMRARMRRLMQCLARFPIRWNHLIEKNSRQFKNLGSMSLSEKRVHFSRTCSGADHVVARRLTVVRIGRGRLADTDMTGGWRRPIEFGAFEYRAAWRAQKRFVGAHAGRYTADIGDFRATEPEGIRCAGLALRRCRLKGQSARDRAQADAGDQNDAASLADPQGDSVNSHERGSSCHRPALPTWIRIQIDVLTRIGF